MAFKLAEAFVSLTTRGVSGVSRSIDAITSSSRTAFDALGSLDSLTTAFGAGLATLGAGGGLVGMLSLAAQAEQTAVSFDVMLGSATAATEMISEFEDFAASTPFSFTGLANAGQTLLSFSVAANSVVDDVAMLSNVASGNEEKLKSLALVYGQVSSAGKLTGGDLLQLINVGFNPLQLIIERTGETMEQVRKRMSDGKVTFGEVQQAFVDATSAGGRFYQMNERQSATALGLWSTLKDVVSKNARELGEDIAIAFDLKAVIQSGIEFSSFIRAELLPRVRYLLAGVSALAEAGREWIGVLQVTIPIIGGVVVAMGAVVAAQLAIAAAQRIILALSGPKGWQILAAGVGIAYASTLLFLDETKKLERQVAQAADATRDAADATKELGTEADTTAKKIQKLESANVDYTNRSKEVFDKISQARRAIAVESGQATSLDFQMDDLRQGGADESDITIYAKLAKQLAEVREEQEKINSLRSAAEGIKGSQLTEEQRYEKELAQLREMHSLKLLTTDEYYRALADAGDKHRENEANKEKSIKEFLGIHDPMSDFRDRLSDLKQALDSGEIDQAQYNSAATTAAEAVAKSQVAEDLRVQSRATASFVDIGGMTNSIQLAALNRTDDAQKQLLSVQEKALQLMATEGIKIQPQPAKAG